MESFTLGGHLPIVRCPHCGVAKPTMERATLNEFIASDRTTRRYWGTFHCTSCAGVVVAEGVNSTGPVLDYFPRSVAIPADLPHKAGSLLQQALDSLHAPAGAVMLAASAVDAMLKQRGLANGTLNLRIKQAADQHLITADMAEWAHDIRMEANDQRHADENATLPTAEDAQRVVDFASALGTILFSLPARVTRGRSPSTPPA